jgi:hypothetical protein
MSMNVPKDTTQDDGSNEQTPEEQADAGLSGEGAASALHHMISRGRQQRHHAGEADDAAGSRHQ